jgi:hypothetical protein
MNQIASIAGKKVKKESSGKEQFNVLYGCSLGLVAFGEDFCTSLQHNWLIFFLTEQFLFNT